MKRQGYVIKKVADMDNLRLAFWKAKRGKQAKKSVQDYQKNLSVELVLLQEQILSGNVDVGDYHFFKIYDPKERQICAAAFRERVLHNALMNICHDDFERYQIFDSYASRKGKGTYAALERAKYYTKKYDWFLKLDVRKFFYSIPHEILKTQLKRLYKDGILLEIFDKIIDTIAFDEKGLFIPVSNQNINKGIPIGNLTSQYFANHYLAVADHFVTEQLRAEGYVRYMDDMVLWGNDKTKLLKKGKQFEDFIKKKLDLELKPFCLNQTKKGLSFLGYRLFPHQVLLNQRSARRFKSKLKRYNYNLNQDIWTQKEFQQHVEPLVAFTEYADMNWWRKLAIQNNG
jgi:hypothetical protein